MQFQTKLHKRRRASVEKVCCAVCGRVFAGSNPARTVPTCCLPALPSVKTTKTHAHMRGSVVSCSRGRSKHHLSMKLVCRLGPVVPPWATGGATCRFQLLLVMNLKQVSLNYSFNVVTWSMFPAKDVQVYLIEHPVYMSVLWLMLQVQNVQNHQECAAQKIKMVQLEQNCVWSWGVRPLELKYVQMCNNWTGGGWASEFTELLLWKWAGWRSGTDVSRLKPAKGPKAGLLGGGGGWG